MYNLILHFNTIPFIAVHLWEVYTLMTVPLTYPRIQHRLHCVYSSTFKHVCYKVLYRKKKS